MSSDLCYGVGQGWDCCPVRRGSSTRLAQGWRRRPQQGLPSACTEVPGKTEPSASHCTCGRMRGRAQAEVRGSDWIKQRSIFPLNELQKANKGPERLWSQSLDVFKAQKEEII